MEHVRCRRGRYLVQIRVPRDLRDRYPTQFVERYLKTADKAEAKERARDEVRAIFAEFRAKRQGVSPAMVEAAMLHVYDAFRARAFDQLAEGGAPADLPEIDVAAVLKTYGIEPTENMVRAFGIMIAGGRTAGATRLENRAGPPPKPAGWKPLAATGETVEAAENLEEYLCTLTSHAKPKTIDMKRRAIKDFCAACPSLADVSRQKVQAWVNQQAQAGLASATIARNVSDVRGYWRYLRSIQKVADDAEPLDKITLPGNGKNGKRDDRKPFAPGDVVKLRKEAQRREDQELADLIHLGMYSGARREELCALRVERVNLKGGYFEVEDAKTPAGWRQVPIHSRIKPTFRRLIGKRADGYVLAGLSANKYDNRGNAIGKRFAYMKRALGFGKQYVFHSIRKTVATLLEDAGVSENVAADILGHEKPRITYGLYSGGTSLKTRRGAVEKIRYPDEAAT